MKFRRKPLKKSHWLIGIFLILTTASSPDVFGQQDVTEYQKRLSNLSSQIYQLQKKIKEEEKKESTFLSRLDRIGFKKNLIKKEITLYTMQLGKTNRELSAIKKNIPNLKTKLDKEKQSIEKILITMYKFGKFNSLQFMLQAEDVGTLISENKHLTLLAQYQENIIADYIKTLAQLKTAEENLETKKKESSHLIQNTKQKRKELESQERESRALIKQIKENRKMFLQTLDELNERAQQLQLLIEKLHKEEISFPFLLIPLYEKKGELPWPIEGKVSTSFGPQRHPRFKTITMNNGIEISPSKNYMVIKSIHPGKVVYSDHLRGYGNLLIIDHGLTYYSLYGHLSEFLVKNGDFVKSKQPIALVGDIGSLEGISLYFEIRFKTKPVNPLQWLKRR